MAERSTGLIISWIFGILGVILLVFIINILGFALNIQFVEDLVSFLNSNLIFLIFISFLFFLGAIFYNLGFPTNLLTPIFDAFGGAFLVSFLIKLIVLIDRYILTGIGNALEAYSFIISGIVFLLILIVGYAYFPRNERIRDIRPRERETEDEEVTEETIEEPVLEKPKTRRRVVRRRTTRR